MCLEPQQVAMVVVVAAFKFPVAAPHDPLSYRSFHSSLSIYIQLLVEFLYIYKQRKHTGHLTVERLEPWCYNH